MHSRTIRILVTWPCLCLTACLGLAACGGGSGSAVHGPKAAAPAHVYRVRLSGKAESTPGAPRGRGVVIIALHDSSAVCFRFAHLHGFADATSAHIHLGSAGHSGRVVLALSTAPRLHHQGCRRVRPALIAALARGPQDYYVNVHSPQYPKGAVRGQL